MDTALIKFLKSSPVLVKYHLSDEEVSELASYLRKHFLSAAVGQVVKMVEEVIAIDPSLDWREILEAAAKKMVVLLRAEAASIRVFDPDMGRLVAFGSYQYSESGRAKSIPMEKSVAGKVIRSGKSYLVPNILREPDYVNKDVVKEQGFNSLMAIPLKIPAFVKNESAIEGAVQIYYREIDKEFDPLEVTNAELMARRISYVLAKRRILDLQKLNSQKEKIVEKIFVKLSHREGIKIKDVFKMIIPELVDIIQIQSCSLFSITPDRQYVQIELEYPTEQESHEPGCLNAIKDHPYWDALITGKERLGDYDFERIDSSYILIKDPINSRLSNDELKRYAAAQNVNSVLLIPLKAEDVINYFLVFYAKDRRQEFTEQEIELLNFLGKEIMKALRIEKLDDVLHDFKNPAIAITGFAKRAQKQLEKNTLEEVKEKISEYLDIVVQETNRMQELIIYPNIEGRERVVDITDILKRRFKINEEAIREQKLHNIVIVREELQPGLFIYCSPLGLERVFDNLLDNATKAIPEQGGELSIKSSRIGEMAVCEIRNTGKISEENIAQIRSGEVKGRGLNIIYRFIQGVHGKLEVFTDTDATTFRVMLPLHRSGT